MEYVDYLLLSVAIGTTGWLCFLWILGKLRIQERLTEIAEQKYCNAEYALVKKTRKCTLLEHKVLALFTEFNEKEEGE